MPGNANLKSTVDENSRLLFHLKEMADDDAENPLKIIKISLVNVANTAYLCGIVHLTFSLILSYLFFMFLLLKCF